MTVYSSFRSCRSLLFSKYGTNTWFNAVLGYFSIRYPPIEARIRDTLRYVELAPKNATVFSYEFGSILRDIGSVFSSILDKLIRNTTKKSTDRYDISHYLKFLIKEVEAVDRIGAQLNCPFQQNMIFPYYKIANEEILWVNRLAWWTPYNNLKHSEIDNLPEGCLANVIYGMASLSILYTLIHPSGHISRLFPAIGHFEPMDKVYSYSFPSYA